MTEDVEREIGKLWRVIREMHSGLAEVKATVDGIRRREQVEELEDGTLTRLEAAKLLGLQPSTLNRMASRRQGPPFKVFRGKAYYRRVDVERWRDEQQRPGAIDKPVRSAPLPLFGAAA